MHASAHLPPCRRKRRRLLVDRLAVRRRQQDRRAGSSVDAEPLSLSGQRERREASYDLLQICRSGSHRYPVGFSGDTIITWDSLAFQPYFTSTASNIGYGMWSHDIGGHMRGFKDDEMAGRWLQFGVFSPIMRLHSSNSEFNGKEPWRYRPEICSMMKEFLRLRHRLLPYLYTMNHRAYEEDIPLMLPMYYNWPEEEKAYQFPNEYLFGSELIARLSPRRASRN